MDEFFPEWGWGDASRNYDLGLGAVDSSLDDDFDLELDEILKEYNQLSGEGQGHGHDRPLDDPLPSTSRTASTSTLKAEKSSYVEKLPSPKKKPKSTSTNPNHVKVQGLSQFVEELKDELEILLFYYRKCYVKNVRTTNYLRLAQTPSYTQVITDLRAKIKLPYIKVETEMGYLAVPSSDCGQDKLPFFSQGTQDWKPFDFGRLELCVYNSYYHKLLFFVRSRFLQMLMSMGFLELDIRELNNLYRDADEDFWRIVKAYRVLETTKRRQYVRCLQKFFADESTLVEDALSRYEKKDVAIFPLVLFKDSKYSATISINELLGCIQHEERMLYEKRYHREGVIDLDFVDWMSVQKEMTLLCGRTESSDVLRTIFNLNKNTKYNHGAMTRTELNHLKQICTTSTSLNNDGLDWKKISIELGTRRSPIRIFQTYKAFIQESKANSYMNTYEDRLSAFFVIKKHLGHMPRIVHRLSKTFGSVSYVSFGSHWQDLNPRYAGGFFDPVEDAALLLAMELYKEEIIANPQTRFGTIEYRLPWRNTPSWKQRAGHLFRCTEKWTLDEDRLIIYAVKRFGLHWRGLSKILPHRKRVEIYNRYELLERKLKGSGATLYQYHSIYASSKPRHYGLQFLQSALNVLNDVLGGLLPAVPDISGNIEDDDEAESGNFFASFKMENASSIFQLKTEFGGNMALISKWDSTKLVSGKDTDSTFTNDLQINFQDPNYLTFLDNLLLTQDDISVQNVESVKVANYIWKTPSREEVLSYLKTFDRRILEQTVHRLSEFIEAIAQTPKYNLGQGSSSSIIPIHCDRRKFDQDDPASVASALHLRRVPLKPMTPEVWRNLTEFEQNVCHAYKAFHVGWKTKIGVNRSIPSALGLTFLPTIRNILATPRELLNTRSCSGFVQEASPFPPENLIKQETILPDSLSLRDTPASIVEDDVELIIKPDAKTLEAHNSLCRYMWNNVNGKGKGMVKRLSVKLRKRALAKEAARLRWEKERAEIGKSNALEISGASSSLKSRDYERKLWFDAFLKTRGKNYTGIMEDFDKDTEDLSWESLGGTLGGPRFLTVLHDHSYAAGYAPMVQMVVEDMNATYKRACENDSAKENMD